MAAQYLIDVLCPPLKLQDILSLVSSGPFCGNVDGALLFRVNSPGPTVNKFTQRLSSRISENTVIIVSLGKVPRLGFSPMGQSLLSEIPSVESPSSHAHLWGKGGEQLKTYHGAEWNCHQRACARVARVSNLLVHIVDTHVDHLQDIVTIVTIFEMELDTIELELNKGKKL